MDFIVRETCSEIRALARVALRNNWVKVAVAMAIYYFLLNTLPLAIDALIPAASFEQYNEVLGETIKYPMVSTLYTMLLSGVFEFGLYSFLIYFVRRREIHAGHLFDGFEYILKTIWLSLRIFVFVFLWSLLLIIPGIIAAIRYSQSYAVLADHPEYSAGQCMGVSKQYMKQNKGKYFCLILTFLGWGILASIPSFFIPETLTGIASVVIDYIVSVPYFFFLAYFNTGFIVFYELVSRNLVAKPVAEPLDETKDPAGDEFNF